MNLNWTVDIGNVLTAVGLLVAFYIAHIQNIRRLEQIETKLSMMYSWFVRRVVNGREESQD
jgi:hypothetical protein